MNDPAEPSITIGTRPSDGEWHHESRPVDDASPLGVYSVPEGAKSILVSVERTGEEGELAVHVNNFSAEEAVYVLYTIALDLMRECDPHELLILLRQNEAHGLGDILQGMQP